MAGLWHLSRCRAKLRPLALLRFDVDAPSSEGVDAAPAPGDVEQLKMTDADRERRVDYQILTERLEPKHRPQQQQGRTRRPRLGAARRGVLHRVLRLRPVVAAKRLRQAPVEESSGVEDPGGDLRCLVLEAIAAQPPGDE